MPKTQTNTLSEMKYNLLNTGSCEFSVFQMIIINKNFNNFKQLVNLETSLPPYANFCSD